MKDPIICLDTKEIIYSYKDYLKSEHWNNVKNYYYLNNKKECAFCNSEEDIDLHHKTYERIGKETLDDLIPLCKDCHNKIHDKKNMYYFNKITEKQKNYITGLLNKYTDLIKDIYYDNSISFLDKYTCRKFKSNDIMNYEANIIIAELKIINCLLDNIKLLKDNTKTTSHLSQDMKILNKFMTDKFNILDKFVFTPDISLVEKINLK